MYTAVRKLTESEVTFTVTMEPEDISVRGNFMETDDPIQDKADEDAILARLERGEIEAWCCVLVTAEYNGFKGIASLGAVSLDENENLEQFAKSEGMYQEALDNLNNSIAEINSRIPRYC